MRLELSNTKNKLYQVESDLKLINTREGFNAFIDLVYSGLNFTEKSNLETKINKIYTELDKYLEDESFDHELIYKIKNAIFKLNNENALDHGIDLNSSIIEQIFQKIKSEKDGNYFDDLISKLKTTNAEKLLKDMIINSQKYYYSEDILNEEETKILADNDLGTILLKKQ